VAKSRIIPIYHGLNIKKHQKIPHNHYINKGIFTIGSITDFTNNKDLIILISAIQNIWSMIPNLYLVLIGNGPLKENFIWVTKKAGIYNKTRFISQPENINRWINSFDLFILTNKNKNFYVNYILQAQFYEKIVMAATNQSIKEYIIDEETGILYPPQNHDVLVKKIIQLYNDPEKIKKIGQQAKQKVIDKFSMERTIEKYIELLNE